MTSLIHFKMCHLSDKKMEGKESFNTIERLRARLLAERHSSKLANEEAESLAHKLIELENILRQEITLREKAERRLQFLEKKLKSSNISSTSGESEQSYSSEKCENSFTTCSSASTDADETEIKPHSTNSPISGSCAYQVSKDSEPVQNHNGPSVSKGCDYPQDLRENPSPNTKDLKNNESRLSISSSRSSTEDSIGEDIDNHNSNTSPSNSSSLEDPGHNPNPSSECEER